VIRADWNAPPHVTAFTTLRTGGVSLAGFESFNLAAHVGDDPDAVRDNRRILAQASGWTEEPVWLEQVHGADIVTIKGRRAAMPRADGAVTSLPSTALAVLTADCLPVLACDRLGTVIGAFHAGWRGLLAGVLENGLAAMNRDAQELLVWIGPAIGAASYQVGPEVRAAYLESDPAHEQDFTGDGEGRWRFSLVGAAQRRLVRAGVSVAGGRWDTYRDADLFFSHRRQAPCGRMATVIRIEGKV